MSSLDENNGFSSDINSEEKQLLNRLSNQEIYKNRRDLTHLRTYSIDDDDTNEIDDALSIQYNNNNLMLWIHIADPSAFITIDSGIDKEAKRRATSVYLADNTIPMLPKNLVRRMISFEPREKRLALSTSVIIDSEGCISSSTIERTIISTNYRLNYQEADELIDYAPKEDIDISLINDYLKKRQQWRQAKGAIQIEETLGKLKYQNDQLFIKYIIPSNSRRLVSEAMILYGSIIAEFACTNNIPMPFRSQLPCKNNISNKKIELNNNRLIWNSEVKRTLNKGTIGITPKPHASLGLDCYIQATSPIRRYLDLVAHRQINHFLDGNSLITESEIEYIICSLKHPLKEAKDLEFEDRKFWQRRWFTRDIDETYKCTFIRWLQSTKQIALIYFDVLEMIIACNLIGDSYIEVGQDIKLKLEPDIISGQELTFKTL